MSTTSAGAEEMTIKVQGIGDSLLLKWCGVGFWVQSVDVDASIRDEVAHGSRLKRRRFGTRSWKSLWAARSSDFLKVGPQPPMMVLIIKAVRQ